VPVTPRHQPTPTPVVTVLALDAHARDLVSFDLPAEVEAAIGTESLGADRWLLLYEAAIHGWLPFDTIAKDEFWPFFEQLIADGVIFYDSEIELGKIERPLDELHGIRVPVLGFVFGY
jgi:hypothetical protein